MQTSTTACVQKADENKTDDNLLSSANQLASHENSEGSPPNAMVNPHNDIQLEPSYAIPFAQRPGLVALHSTMGTLQVTTRYPCHSTKASPSEGLVNLIQQPSHAPAVKRVTFSDPLEFQIPETVHIDSTSPFAS